MTVPAICRGSTWKQSTGVVAVSGSSAFSGTDRSTLSGPLSPKTRNGAVALVEFVGRGQARSPVGERASWLTSLLQTFFPEKRLQQTIARPRGPRRKPGNAEHGCLQRNLAWARVSGSPAEAIRKVKAPGTIARPRGHTIARPRGHGDARNYLILQGKSRFFCATHVHLAACKSVVRVATCADRRSLVSFNITLVSPRGAWGFSQGSGAVS